MELLAPVGDESMLKAAIDAGCDAVYFGIKGLNMRAAANNFSVDEIKKVVNYCHENKVKAYCTVNIIIFESELELLNSTLTALKESEIDAVICWDLAVIKKCKGSGIPIHLSTQASVSNSASAQMWKEMGIKRIILARECSLEDIKHIKEKTGMEIECFIHGARCISLSGRCFLSYDLFGKSANRGECLQPCRREYRLTDEENKEIKVTNNFILSAKDLCALPLLPQLISLGMDSFKIEGRNRGAEYVYKVVSVYRKALDAIEEGQFSNQLVQELIDQLREVYNKDFSSGFYVNYPYHELANAHGSKATTKKVRIGKVINFYPQKNVAEFKVESENISLGETLAFVGPTTGYHEQPILEMKDDEGNIEKAEQGKIISVKLSQKVRINDKIFLVRKTKEKEI